MIRHPAKYSDDLLPTLKELLSGYEKVLDPFAGVGKLKLIRPDAVLNEIELPWAVQGKPAPVVQSDTLRLPFETSSFDAICTSCTYGNRMADHHNARDGSRRNTYRHSLGRPLHLNNSGNLQWGEKYRYFHAQAWIECRRVLRPGGRFILNISDHIRKGERIFVSDWHYGFLLLLGFAPVDRYEVRTPRLRNGENYELRVDCENIFVFELMED